MQQSQQQQPTEQQYQQRIAELEQQLVSVQLEGHRVQTYLGNKAVAAEQQVARLQHHVEKQQELMQRMDQELIRLQEPKTEGETKSEQQLDPVREETEAAAG